MITYCVTANHRTPANSPLKIKGKKNTENVLLAAIFLNPKDFNKRTYTVDELEKGE